MPRLPVKKAEKCTTEGLRLLLEYHYGKGLTRRNLQQSLEACSNKQGGCEGCPDELICRSFFDSVC